MPSGVQAQTYTRAIDERETNFRLESRRLDPYEQLANADPSDPEHAAWCRYVRADFIRRSNDGALDRRGRAVPRRPSKRSIVWSSMTVLAITAGFGAVSLGLSLTPRAEMMTLVIALTATGVVAWASRRHTISVRGTWGQCPACGYDLLNLPDAVPEHHLGFSIGPRRCPECGEPWPRVPDPA